ncbi:hypothetical protein [Streptomyces sp. NBC_00483]|uniref:hypothetical protein n=1 Tax=Streptomyces sp. NBC_00483 TaxID=2975756 RepID=UPI002E1819C0
MTTTDPVQLARDAAESVRSFNHRTFPTRQNPGLVSAPTAYSVLGAFKALADRLPQSFEQIAHALNTHLQAGHIAADYGTPAEHVAAAASALQEAEDHAYALADALSRAWSATNPLSHTGPLTDAESE